jgi:4-amino-4-deoxy-L-arabinose transferase-like glycosyltransferase
MLLGLVLCLPYLCVDFIPKRDTSKFYMPMIQAFAEGRYSDAYFPGIPPLFSTIGGLLAKLTGMNNILCAKLVSSFFYVISCIPMYLLALLIKDRKTAICSTLLFLFCASLIEYAGTALLDTGKTFFLLSTLCAIYYFYKRQTLLTGFLCSFSLAGLALIRAEGVIFSVIGGLIMIVIEIGFFQKEKKSFPTKSFLAAIVFLLLLSPWLKYEYDKTGYFVTDARQATSVAALLQKEYKLNLPEDPCLEQLLAKKHVSRTELGVWDSLLKGVFKGLYLPYFLVLLIPAYIYKLRRKDFIPADTIFIGVFCIHSLILIIIVGGWTQTRYIIAAAPPLFITASTTLFLINDKLKSKNLKYVLIVFAVFFSAYRGYKELLPEKEKKELAKTNLRNASAWLMDNKSKYISRTTKSLSSTRRHYHNGNQTIVFSATSQFCVLNNFEYVEANKYSSDIIIEDIIKICQLKSVEFLVLERRMKEGMPKISNNLQTSGDFLLLKTFGNIIESQVQVFGFKSNLEL